MVSGDRFAGGLIVGGNFLESWVTGDAGLLSFLLLITIGNRFLETIIKDHGSVWQFLGLIHQLETRFATHTLVALQVVLAVRDGAGELTNPFSQVISWVAFDATLSGRVVLLALDGPFRNWETGLVAPGNDESLATLQASIGLRLVSTAVFSDCHLLTLVGQFIQPEVHPTGSAFQDRVLVIVVRAVRNQIQLLALVSKVNIG